MFTSFEAKNFRGFRDLVISELSRVNLIAGMNNVGKTSLLEALFVHCGAYNPELALTINSFRGIEEVKLEYQKSAEFPWNSLFNLFDAKQIIELRSEHLTKGYRVLRLREVTPNQVLVGTKKGARKSQYTELSVRARILRLEYEEENGGGFYDLIFDPADRQRVPFIRPTPQEPPFPAFFQAARIRMPFEAEAELFGKLEIQKKKGNLI